jgi:hypothetical protein
MKNKRTGRHQFSKYKPIILLCVKIFALFGKKNNYHLLNIFRNLIIANLNRKFVLSYESILKQEFIL